MAQSTYAYSPYGVQTTSGSGTTTPFGFEGGYTDKSGLIYLLSRYYDPSMDRFLSVDPKVSTTNSPYMFAGGDPVNAYDPSGQSWWEPWTWNATDWENLGWLLLLSGLQSQHWVLDLCLTQACFLRSTPLPMPLVHRPQQRRLTQAWQKVWTKSWRRVRMPQRSTLISLESVESSVAEV